MGSFRQTGSYRWEVSGREGATDGSFRQGGTGMTVQTGSYRWEVSGRRGATDRKFPAGRELPMEVSDREVLA